MNAKGFLFITGGHFLTDFYINFIPVLLPLMTVKLHLSLAQAGLVSTAAMLSANFLQPFFGYVYDRRPGKMWLVMALIFSGVFMCLSPLSNSYYIFLLLPLLSGIGNGIYHPAGSVYSYQLNQNNRGFMMSLFSTAGALGYALAPAVVAFVITRWGFPSLSWLLIPIPLMMLGLGRVKYKPHKDEEENNKPFFSGLLTGVVLILASIMILRAWGNLAYTNYLPFLLKERGIAYDVSANILTVFLLVGALGGLIAGKLSDRVGRKIVIVLTLAIASLSSVGFLLAGGMPSLVFLIINGLMVGACQPVLVVLGQEIMPVNVGLASGISMGFVWGVGSLGVYLNGLIADHSGLTASYWLTTIILGLGTLIALTIKESNIKGGQKNEGLRQGS
ncbi:MAG: MFS transporter [Chitinophagales bacterium]